MHHRNYSSKITYSFIHFAQNISFAVMLREKSEVPIKFSKNRQIESMFELSIAKHFRGHELKLTKHRSKLEVRRHFFTERLVNRWNSLDHHTVNASTVNSFKNGLQRLKQYWMGFFED